jgi:tetratricopeptide (TPR) repeat protein
MTDGRQDEPLLARHAVAAVRAGDPALALAAWTAVRARAPGDAEAVTGMAQALLLLDRLDEAAALADAAAADEATARAAALVRARIADRKRDWAASLGHWHTAAAMAPALPDAWIGASQALCKLGRADEADDVLLEALRGQPDHFGLRAAYCRAAETAQNWAEAGRRWSALRADLPDRPEAAAGLARALRGQGRLEEAEAAAMAAMRRFPAHVDAHVTYARIAMARLDWVEALRRWTAVGQRFPLHPSVAQSRAHCQARAALIDGTTQAPPDGHIDILAPAAGWTLDRGDTASVAKFLAQFESLGSSCEFGLVQRKYGAEPLGLLRWSNMQAPWLIQALEERFAGVGTREQTSIILLRDEYGAVDDRFKFGIHLGIKPSEATPDRVLASQCRRLAFLRDKLLAELDGQEKIFVFSAYRITDREVATIVERLSAYGPNLLLCVRAASEVHPAGSVEIASDRLVVGYSAQEALERRGAGWNIQFDAWLGFCETAWLLWAELRGTNT